MARATRQRAAGAWCSAGPTGAGKSDWALRARGARCPLEIVSVDSALVYRGLDIGTAKPVARSARAHPASPDRHLRSRRELLRRAVRARMRSAAIAEIHARGRVPLLVGGTMLYLRALLHGLAAAAAGAAGAAARSSMRARRRQGWPALHAELAGLDPEAAARIRPQRRAAHPARAGSVPSTGRPISELQRVTAAARSAATPCATGCSLPRDRARAA